MKTKKPFKLYQSNIGIGATAYMMVNIEKIDCSLQVNIDVYEGNLMINLRLACWQKSRFVKLEEKIKEMYGNEYTKDISDLQMILLIFVENISVGSIVDYSTSHEKAAKESYKIIEDKIEEVLTKI